MVFITGRIAQNSFLTHHLIKENGAFPNNSKLAVLHYKGVFELPSFFPGRYINGIFAENHWSNSWDQGVYTYHHYHSITHEVLGFYEGKTRLMLGGPGGLDIEVEKGDVLIIPAGVGHKNLLGENDVRCIGAYPSGHDYDIKKGIEGERPYTDHSISIVGKPVLDPVFGTEGGLLKFW